MQKCFKWGCKNQGFETSVLSSLKGKLMEFGAEVSIILIDKSGLRGAGNG